MGELPTFEQQLLDELRPRVQPVIAARQAEQAKMRAYEDTCRAFDIPILNTLNTLSRQGILATFDTPQDVTIAEDDTMRLSMNVSATDDNDGDNVTKSINIHLGVDHPGIANTLAAAWTHGAHYSLPIIDYGSAVANLGLDGAYSKDEFGNCLNPSDISVRRQGRAITRLHHLGQSGYPGSDPKNIFDDMPETPRVIEYSRKTLETIVILARFAAHELQTNGGDIRRPSSNTLNEAIKFATAGPSAIKK